MSEELKKLREAAEKRGALIDPINWASRPQLFDLSYLHPDWVRHYATQGLTKDYPGDFYLDKKTEQPNEVTNNLLYYNRGDITNFTGRYTELLPLGKTEGKLKELEVKLNKHIDKTKARLEDGF